MFTPYGECVVCVCACVYVHSHICSLCVVCLAWVVHTKSQSTAFYQEAFLVLRKGGAWSSRAP